MINFLIGRQTDPLQEKILEKAVEKYQQYPELKTFIIVPNHIKFTTEINAISKLAHNKNEQAAAVKNLQVLSFSRLAWYFLKDTSQSLPTQLDDAAAAMLLSKIISQRQSDLLLYKNTSINSGLVKQLYSTILEVHSGNLDLNEIDETHSGNLDLNEIDETHLDLETRSKVHDLRIIYEAFASEIADKFVTKDELQLKLNELLVNSDQLENSNFYFSDFSHFSLQEKLTVKLIIKKALNVNFAFKTQIGKINSQPKEGDYDYVIQKTIGELLEFTKQKNLPYQLNFFPKMKRNKSIELNRLWTGEDKAKPANLDQVQLVKADSRYAEAYYVVHTIYQQVAFKNYRYRDFLVLAPNLQEYETYLQPILRQNEVPFFDDLQQQMKYHSLVILIENIAQLFAKPLQTQNLLAIMKTGLLIPQWYHDQDAYIYDIDKLENFVLAHGINHNLWRSDFKKFIDAKLINLDQMDERLAKINRLKDFFIQKLTTLIGNLQKETDTRKALTIFFDFFTTNGVTNQLEIWRENAIDKGDLQQAQQPEQVWQLLLTLLEDYLLINPKTFSAKDFFNMLVNGFKEATFSQIPSTLDAVNLSEMGMIQTNNYKQVFIIGATSTNLPAIQKTPSFFTSENLQQLAENFATDSYLEDVQQTNNLDQNYQFGMSLALGKDRVYVSYPVLNTANEQLNPSIYYEQLKRWDAPEFSQHDLPEKTSDLLSFITNPQASLGYLAFLANKNKEVNGLLELTRQYLPEKTQAVIDGEKFNNQPEDIGLSLAQQLYGQNLNSSVSQLEKYYQNSFEYFLIYGLHLHKRFENEFDVIQAGNYFHETFDYLVKELNQQGLKLAEIDQLKLQKILQSVRQTIQNQAQYKQLLTDPFNQYLFRELDKTTDKVANNWHNSVKHTPLQPQYSELSFGLGEKIKGLNFTVPDLAGKHQVFLRGKIDRVDLMADSPAKELAQVIDYKSSAKKFNLSLFYNGISLQMISYLDVLTKNSSFFAGENGLDLLGAFYQTVTRKLARLNSKVMVGPDLQLKTQQYDTKPQLKYTGVMNNDPELLAKADPVLISGNSPDSAIYAGLGTRSNGRFKLPVNSSFSKEELDLLLAYDEKLIKQAASEILSGKIKLNPYRYGKDNNALTYSDYRDIFFFDAKLNPNGYHEIATSLAKKELLSKIKEKLGTEND